MCLRMRLSLLSINARDKGMTPKQWLKQRFPPDSRVGHWLRSTYWSIRPDSVRGVHMWVISAYARSVRPVRFIQVGSNDAGYGDPLRYHILHDAWRGIMIEPLPFIFRRLRARYANLDGLIFENVAIDKQAGQRSFYHLRDDDDPALPPWYDQLGSFLKENVFKHADLLPDMEQRIVETPVQCASLDQLINKHEFVGFQLLHVDAEGYDWEILKTLHLDVHRPDIILFEHKHLQASDYGDCLNHLHAAGYETNADSVDTLALRQEALQQNPAVNQAWRKARARLGGALDKVHACI